DCVIRRRKKSLRGGVLAETAAGAITVPEFVWCGEILSNLFESRHEVELDDLLTVGRIREAEPEHLAIPPRLLQTIARDLVRRLCVEERKGKISRVGKEIIYAFRWSADEALTDRNDPSVGDRSLLRDRMRLVIPARGLKARDDELATGISFVHSSGLFEAAPELCEKPLGFADGVLDPTKRPRHVFDEALY